MGDAGGMDPVADGKYEDEVGWADEADGNGDCSDPCAKIDGDGMATCKFSSVLAGGGFTGASVAAGGPEATTTSSASCGSG